MNGINLYNPMLPIGRSDIQDIRQALGTVGIIDIGTCYDYKASTNTCSVITSKVLNSRRAVYRNVEVLCIGNQNNAFRTNPDGSLCLVFVPRSCVPNTRTMAVDLSADDYAKHGAKCIPVSNAANTEISVGFGADGSFGIAGDDYAIRFTATDCSVIVNDIMYSIGDGGTLISAGGTTKQTNTDGSWSEQALVDGSVAYRLSFKTDGTYTIQRVSNAKPTPAELDDIDSFTNYVWTEEWAADGTYMRTLRGTDNENILKTVTDNIDGSTEEVLNNADGNAILTTTKAADGSVTIVQTDGSDTLNTVTMSAEGDVTIVNKGETTIKIGIDGTLSVETGDAITLKAGGDISITPSAELSLSGNLTVDGDVTITGDLSNDGKASLAGGNLTADA